jgi:hypothetical protein
LRQASRQGPQLEISLSALVKLIVVEVLFRHGRACSRSGTDGTRKDYRAAEQRGRSGKTSTHIDLMLGFRLLFLRTCFGHRCIDP